jgi:hypothetical protein
MRLHLLHCTMLALCLGGFGIAPQATSFRTMRAYQTKDGSILKPTNSAYAEAMEFVQFLESQGIAVKSVHNSKLNGFFQGLEKAAFFRTDKGIMEVIFFPEPNGAERIRVKEQRRAGRYLYSFEGQPHPNPPGDRMDAGRPIYFLMHRNWFIVINSEELYNAVKRALVEADI